MSSRPFVPAADYGTFRSWCRLRGLDAPAFDELPRVGIVAEDAAIGFLVQTDGRNCYIESLISNPNEPKSRRERATHEAVAGLLIVAKSLGYKAAICLTELDVVQKLAASFGAKHRPHMAVIEGVL